ncbi:MAG TPA: hypothetical protein VEX86_12670 [Longimicrobium sp.]|nr:hypothetical protein [Longimicrobium sp.]
MKIRTIAMALAVAGMPSLAAAQQGTPPAQGQHGQHHRGEGQMRGQRGGGLQALIARRQQLNLSDAQVQRLTAIQQRMQSQNQALMERLRAQRRQAGLPEMAPARGEGGRDAQRGERRQRGTRAQRPQLTEQQREALRRFRQQSEPTRQQIMQNRQAALRDAQAVLTEQQRQQVQQWMSQRGRRGGRDGHQGRRGRGRGQHEQHQGQGTSRS